MANIKRIHIEGELPFNCHENQQLQPYLAALNAPLVGVRLRWGNGPCRMQPNEHGGQTAFYSFVVEGEEALSWGWIDGFCDAVRAAGGCLHGEPFVRDLEAGAGA